VLASRAISKLRAAAKT